MKKIIALLILVGLIISCVPPETDPTVYITDTGTKYHRSDCRYLDETKHSLLKSEAKEQGYTACSVCDP